MTKWCKHPTSIDCLYCSLLTKAGVPEDDMPVVLRGFWQSQGKSAYSGVGCSCCGEADEPYMLKNPVWVKANQGKSKGFLCLSCVERRLKRKLKQSDFIDAPINFGMFGFDCRFMR